MRYEKFRFMFPPRPKNAVDPEEVNFWDNGSLVAQPKLNGSNSVIFTNGTQFHVMNRHGQRLTNFNISDEVKRTLTSGDNRWMVLNGEYLNKNKNDETGNSFNHKLILFDILVYKSNYLVGTTFQERIELMDKLYGKNKSEKEYLYSISENIYRVKSYENNFKNIFDDLSRIDVVEGLVMKRKNAKLEVAGSVDNNTKSQIKVRKATRNYKY